MEKVGGFVRGNWVISNFFFHFPVLVRLFKEADAHYGRWRWQNATIFRKERKRKKEKKKKESKNGKMEK